MKDLVKKKDGLLAEPLIKPERDKPSMYRTARANMDKKFSRMRRRRRRR